MSTSPFPFNSPSPPQTPTTADATHCGIFSTPPSPQPDTLPIRRNPFNYVVVKKQDVIGTNPFEPLSPRAASSNPPTQAPNPFEDPARLAQPLPTSHSRKGSSPLVVSQPIAERLINPFSDANRLTSPLPSGPDRNKANKKKHERNGSTSSTIASSVTFNTAISNNSCRLVSHPELSPDRLPSLSKINSRVRRSKIDSVHSLDREVRLREAAKQQDQKLRLERAKDEVRRLSKSVSSSRFCPSTKSYHSQPSKNTIPSLLTNGFFWAALLLAQAGLVSTGAAFAVILRDKKVGEDVSVGTGTVFWLVCSLSGLVVGFLSVGLICARKGNCCLGTQDRLGFNEIQDLGIRDEEFGRRVGKGLLYLGVGERNDESVPGGLGGEHPGAADVSLTDGRVSGRIVGGIDRDSLQNRVKDPSWKDLYMTPSDINQVVSGRRPDSGARKRYREEVEGNADSQDPDLGSQPLKPTPSQELNDAELSIDTRFGTEVSGMTTRRGRQGISERQGERPSLQSSMKSIYSRTSTLNDWTSTIGREVHTWSPLERLERVLSGQEVRDSAQGQKTKDEGMELVDWSSFGSRAAEGEILTGKECVEQEGSSVKLVGKQVAEYHGSWSPEIIQQRMQQKEEEKRQKVLEAKRGMENSVFIVGEDS